MCCGGGFGGGGGGGGTGNLSGTLTEGFIPVASGVHALDDSPIEIIDGVAVSHDLNFEVEQGNAGEAAISVRSVKTTDPDPNFYSIAARGTVDVPLVLGANDVMLNLQGKGYTGTDYAASSSLKLLVDGTPSAGVMPGRWEFNTLDEDNFERVAFVINADGTAKFNFDATFEAPVTVNSRTINRYQALTVVASEIDIDASLSDWFDVEITAATEFQTPTNPVEGGKMKIRIRLNGTLGLNPTFDAGYRFVSDVAPVFIDSASTYYMYFEYNEIDEVWDCVGGPRGPFGGS